MLSEWVATVAAPTIAGAVAAAAGWLFGRRRTAAEVDNINVEAGATAIASLLSTIESLRTEIAGLRGEVDRLKDANTTLTEENRSLRDAVADLRRLVSASDHYQEYYDNRPNWGGNTS